MTATGHVRLVERAKGAQWYAKYRLPDGKQVQTRLGPAWTRRSTPEPGYLTRPMAEAALRDLLADAGASPGPASSRTFGEACREFLRHRENEKHCAETTMRDYRSMIRSVLGPELGKDTPLADLTEDRLRAFRDQLVTDRGVGPKTARKHLVVLNAILDRARRQKWIDTNPLADVEKVQIPKASGRFRALTPDQVMALARAATTDQERALYVVAAFTGLRQGELRALRWGDVDFANAFIRVEHNRPAQSKVEKLPKSGKVRSVPLVPQAARALDQLSRRDAFTGPTDYVFVNTFGGVLHDDTMRRDFHAALEAAGLGHLRSSDLPASERLKFHDLRHSFGTLAVQMWPLSDVQGYMGHADISTTMIYVHHKPRVDAAEQLGAMIDRQLGVVDGCVPDVSRTAATDPQLSATERN